MIPRTRPSPTTTRPARQGARAEVRLPPPEDGTYRSCCNFHGVIASQLEDDTWDVPDDYQTLFNLLGGDSKVNPALQSYLSQPNGYGMYDGISNEFDLGEQFGPDYAGDPAETLAAVRNIENTVLTVGANNATDRPQKVGVSITAPPGGTITPSSTTIEVPPHGQGTATLTTESTGATQSLNLTILVAAPGSLLSTFNNVGISDSSDASAANFDGDGYSYSAEALAEAGLAPGGTVSADGLTFTWPNVASCADDNILAAGQTMLVSGTAGAGKLGLLESSTNGGTSGPITITCTDGTSTTETLSSSDWAKDPGAGETAIATMNYRNEDGGGNQAITMYVYATTVPIDPSKTVASITFPGISNPAGPKTSAMHIFAVTTG